MFVSVTFPVFLTLPLVMIKPPGAAGLAGQTWLTSMPDVVTSGLDSARERDVAREPPHWGSDSLLDRNRP